MRKKIIKYIFVLLTFTGSVSAIDNVRIYPSFYAITYPETYLNTFPMANLMGISASMRAVKNTDFILSAAFQSFHESYIITDWKMFSLGSEYQLFGENILEYHYYPRFGFHVDYYMMKSDFDNSLISSVGFTINSGIDLYFPNKVFLTPEFGISYILEMPEYAKSPLFKFKLSIGYHISISSDNSSTAVQDEEDEKKKLD